MLLSDEEYKKIAKAINHKDDKMFRFAVDLVVKSEGSYDYFFSDQYKQDCLNKENDDIEYFCEKFQEFELENKKEK